MPLPTITTFSPNTTIRSSEVNTNFSNLRVRDTISISSGDVTIETTDSSGNVILTPGSGGEVQIAMKANARARNASNQNITANTTTKLVLDTEDWDVGGDFDTTNNNFTAPITGYYYVLGSARFNTTADADVLGLSVYVNNSPQTTTQIQAGGSNNHVIQNGGIYSVTAGQAIDIRVINFSNNDTITAGSTTTYGIFTLMYV